MHQLDVFRIARAAGGLEVDGLAACHAGKPDGVGEHGQHAHPNRIRKRVGLRGEHCEGQRLQRVAGQDRRAFIERTVTGRPSASQVVIVHRGQVVVDQAVGMDQFHGRRGRVEIVRVRTQRLPGDVHQQRAQPLAAAQHAVAHRFLQARRGLVGAAQRALQCQFHALLRRVHTLLEFALVQVGP